MITPKLPLTVFFVAFRPYKLSVCLSTHQVQIGGGGGRDVNCKHWSDNDTWQGGCCHDDGGDISLIASCVSTNQRRSCVSPRTNISRDLAGGGVQVAAPPRPRPRPGQLMRLVTSTGSCIPHLSTTDIMTFMGTIASTHHRTTAALHCHPATPVLIRI